MSLQELASDSASLPSTIAGQETGGWSQTFRALRHRNFQLFAAGQTVSLIGTFMQTVAQSWLVYRLTRSEWLLGAAWFCTQIPVFVLAPIGGLAADRYSRHRIVVATQTVAMIQALSLAALTLTGRVQVWHILAFAVMLGVVNAFDMPGRQSLLIQMTGKEDLLSAISLNSAIFNAARVIGPAIAGFVVALAGEGLCFLFNGISFIAVIAALLAMKLPPYAPRAVTSPWRDIADGFRYAHQTPFVRTVLSMVAAITISGMPALVLMPFFAEDIFHRGSRGLGFLLGAMGAGAVIGTLWLGRRGKTSGLMTVMFTGAATLGLAFLTISASTSFYLALAAMLVVGFSIMRQNASANTLIQTFIPDHYRGRIMALYSMTVVGIGPFGSLAAGALANRIGVRWTVAAGGALALAAAAIFRIRIRSLQGKLA